MVGVEGVAVERSIETEGEDALMPGDMMNYFQAG
jgi:hypothetical protein